MRSPGALLVLAELGEEKGQELMAGLSGHGVLLGKAGAQPFTTLHDLAKVFCGLPHVGIADIQRRETKAQDVGVQAAIARPEVTNHAARNQGLHDGVSALGPGQAHLRAAQGFFGRGGDAKAVPVQAGAHQLHEQTRERQ